MIKYSRGTCIPWNVTLIDDSLSWKQHISYINNKISRILFRIKQAQYCLPSDSSKTFCYSLIVSYGLMAGGNATESVLNTKLQFCTNVPFVL